MHPKRLGDLTHLFGCRWAMDQQTFLFVGPMQPFDVTVFIRPMRWAEIGLNAQAEQKAHERRGKVASARAADPPRVTIEGKHSGQTILAQKLDDGLQSRFCRELLVDWRIEPDGCPSIDKIAGFHDMLTLAFWISRHGRVIFEIDLDFLHGITRF
jgi:hypothetical protein